MIPLLYPSAGLTFMGSVLRIGGRIFPILILPCLAAWLVRYTLPRLQAWLLPRAHWSFYIWGVTLTLSMVLATRALVLYAPGWMDTLLIVAVSIVCCIFQFGTGRLVGRIYSHGDKVTAGQSLGQKNTGFLIWLGYSYMPGTEEHRFSHLAGILLHDPRYLRCGRPVCHLAQSFQFVGIVADEKKC